MSAADLRELAMAVIRARNTCEARGLHVPLAIANACEALEDALAPSAVRGGSLHDEAMALLGGTPGSYGPRAMLLGDIWNGTPCPMMPGWPWDYPSGDARRW